MNYSLCTVGLAKILLIPLDSRTLGKLYERAPKKKMPSIVKSIPNRIRIKMIGNLLDRGNVTYTISQISEGRLDSFYHVTSADDNVQMKNYSDLKELVEKHDQIAGRILITLFKSQDSKQIESYFDNSVKNIDILCNEWNKINWELDNNENDKSHSLVENQLRIDVTRLKKANTKLKEKVIQVTTEKSQEKQDHKKEIKRLKKEFQLREQQHSSSELEERKRAVKEVQIKCSVEKNKLIQKNNLHTDVLNRKINQIKKQVTRQSEDLERYYSVFQSIRRVHLQNLTLIAYDSVSTSVENEYVYIGVPKSVEQIIEWVRLIEPPKILLIQEITTRYFWMTLMHEIHNEGYETSVVIISKYELMGEK